MSSNKYKHAQDWEFHSEGVEYSPEKDLYWANNRIYCPLSASHNGIIGVGRELKDLLKQVLPE